MPNKIQPGENSTGGGADGILYNSSQPEWQPQRPLSLSERRWSVELELQPARQRLECRQLVCGLRNSLHFSSHYFREEFCLESCPFQPPSIRPISLTFSERAIYFLLSSDFVSQRIIRNIFKTSVFRMASRTYGCFSSRGKKPAIVIASIISTRNLSTFCPRV